MKSVAWAPDSLTEQDRKAIRDQVIAETRHVTDALSTEELQNEGARRAYPVPESALIVPTFEIPTHWPRAYTIWVGSSSIAVIWGELDPPSDTLYLFSECVRDWSYRPLSFLMLSARAACSVRSESGTTSPSHSRMAGGIIRSWRTLANLPDSTSSRVYGSGHFPRLPVQWLYTYLPFFSSPTSRQPQCPQCTRLVYAKSCLTLRVRFAARSSRHPEVEQTRHRINRRNEHCRIPLQPLCALSRNTQRARRIGESVTERRNRPAAGTTRAGSVT